jgi:hypothetical protein
MLDSSMTRNNRSDELPAMIEAANRLRAINLDRLGEILTPAELRAETAVAA